MSSLLKTGRNTKYIFYIQLCIFIDLLCQVNGEAGGWTIWYNVDHPRNGEGDDESYEAIRRHGYIVCGDSLPVKAACRRYGDDAVFTQSDAKDVTSDYLSIPCTTAGLVCKNDLQWNDICRDYQIQFFCHVKDDRPDDPESNTTNYGIIALVAGMSVLIPLLFVVLFQCIRTRRDQLAHRRRQRRARRILEQIPTGNPEAFRAPPTYESLFGQNNPGFVGSTENLYENPQESRANATPDSQGQNSSVYQISNGQLVSQNQTNVQSGHSARHYPGMHVSILDFLEQDGGDLTTTPPPTYGDAMEILGVKPPKYSEHNEES